MHPLPFALSFLLGAPFPEFRSSPSPAAHRVAATSVGPLLPWGDQCAILIMANPAPGDLSQDGIVSLTGAELAAAIGSFSGVDFDHVGVAAGDRGPLPDRTDSVHTASGLPLLPIRRVDLDGDGIFELGDRIEFHAHGPSHWAPHPDWPDSLRELVVHPWDLERRYLVRLDAPTGSPDLPVVERTGSPRNFSSTLRPVWAGKHLLLESDDTLHSGREWFWSMAERKGLLPGALAHPATRDLPGLASSTATAVIRLALDYPGSSDTLRAVGGSSRLLGTSGYQAAWSISGLKSSGNEYRWTLSSQTNARFESYTVHYQHAPSITEPVPFPAPIRGAFQMAIQGARVSDTLVAIEQGVARRLIPLRDGLLRDSAPTLDTWYVPLRAKEPGYRLLAWKQPTGKLISAPEEFSKTFDRDLVVVAPDSFLDVASQYAGFRSDARRTRPFTTSILRAEDVWLLHGNGSRDPLALRSAFALARNRWGASHALLLGGGHFDPRGLRGLGIPPIPIWTQNRMATDAILQYLDPGEVMGTERGQDIALGRIPARNRREAQNWISKLRTFEDPGIASTGLWRNTFLATADDLQVQRGGEALDDFTGSSGHTRSSERILDAILEVRPWLNVRKVYLVQFPANALLEKPEAQTALVDELGRGVVAFNYMGHGASDILSDERFLDTRSAITRLRNGNTPFLFFAGSCTVGRHDMIDSRGLSEALVVADRLGAFAAVSGTRVSYGAPNESLAVHFWTNLFRSAPGAIPTTLGEALMKAGNTAERTNSDIYNLLGDPAMAPFPAGSPMALNAAPKSLAALDTIRLTGRADARVRITLQTRPSIQTGVYVHRSASYKDTDSTGPLKAGERTYTQEFETPGRSLLSVSTEAVSGSYSTLLRTPPASPSATRPACPCTRGTRPPCATVARSRTPSRWPVSPIGFRTIGPDRTSGSFPAIPPGPEGMPSGVERRSHLRSA